MNVKFKSPRIKILGIDVGSVSIHTVLMNGEQKIVHHSCAYHEGEIEKTLKQLIRHLDISEINYVAATDNTPFSIKSSRYIDEQSAMIKAAAFFHSDYDAVLHVGGEKFSLSRFNRDKKYIGAKHNTSCAAGTGSFLDQQAKRLNLKGGSEELSQKALSNTRKRPQIATRCAVFAKTDLIHAQQEGYDIEQICDGLCYGLAKNIVNTLFKGRGNGNRILFCGGVSWNTCVKRHLESITGHQFIVDPYSKFYGAAGSALYLAEELLSGKKIREFNFKQLDDLFALSQKKDILQYPPLSLNLSDFPDFSSGTSYIEGDVEADIYSDPSSLDHIKGYLGLDVGSTSTKAILIDDRENPIAGFYTRTASRPVQAVQSIFKAFDRFFSENKIQVQILGCGTTGSGRRISASIIGADMEPDEITAHAAAACWINPEVDTIIEIGGQDAKFTLIKDGTVISSTMNSACAAGTGSFIEEQALKLRCPLSAYSGMAEGVSAPMASDRCTVFMERDINYYLAKGYEKREILATVLHSVRDNYLTKVANISRIGSCLLFQGATAKNKALIAAFEQKLNQPIQVSRYCHLTGALGVALLVKKDFKSRSRFKGFDLWQQDIPVKQEVCNLCTNHCKLTITRVSGETQAYGFLCGRDYDTLKKIPLTSRFSLAEQRKNALPDLPAKDIKQDITIGLPRALHLYEDYPLWQYFFKKLGIKTKSSRLSHPVKKGRETATAEFCAPMTALHGHVDNLISRCDFVFLPFYFEEKNRTKNQRRQYCYYTQFSPSVISCLSESNRIKLISPVIKYVYTNFHTKLELYKALKKLPGSFSFFDISNAFDKAIEFKEKYRKNLLTLVPQKTKAKSDLRIILLGRPYTVLDPAMNNRIPQLFENLGVDIIFQDMLDISGVDFTPIAPLLDEIHWNYAAAILKCAYTAAVRKNVYPVFITSFRCSPDSFALDYFKQIMDSHQKPYLVLELDEHDSSVGYETRVEAAVQAFKNHSNSISKAPVQVPYDFAPRYQKKIDGKTIIFPNWDAYTGELIVSVLKSEGVNALLMEETEETLKKSLLTNSGQCIPLNAVASGFIHTVEKHGLDPAQCALWLNPSDIACNIKLYPYHIKRLLLNHKNGFENSNIYKGELSLFDISFKASTNAYFAYMFGGLLRSVGCKIRPYEVIKGETDKALKRALQILNHAFENNGSKENALKKAMSEFYKIQQRVESKPKVAIFGDLYVRDNRIMNQDLIRYIEDHGGEVITTPYFQYLKIIANSYFKKWFKEGKYYSLISNKTLLIAMNAMEKKYYKYFDPVLGTSKSKAKDSCESILRGFDILQEHTGESMDNILKIHHLLTEHPDLKLLVQTNPAFCCPALITEAMAHKIEKVTGIPIVSITYDISGGNKNKVIIPFLENTGRPSYSQSLKVSV